jgi:hypothetical protein
MPSLEWLTHHRLLTLGLGVAAVVVAVAVGVWFFVLSNPTTPLNLRQALRLYRQDQRGAADTALALPTAGVYRYRTTGGEHLSFADISRSFPAATDMIVTDDRCATLRWEPLVQHVEGLVECPLGGGAFGITSASSYEDIAGTRTTEIIRCPARTYLVPPDPRPGLQWHATCHAAGQTVVVTGRIVGMTSVRVGGHAVPALHTRLDLAYSGAESGTNPNDYWISPRDGLILGQQETVDMSQSAGPLGSVRYTEQMGIRIASATPLR